MKRLFVVTFLFISLVAIFANIVASLYYAPFPTQMFGAFLAVAFFCSPFVTYFMRALLYFSYYSWRNIFFPRDPRKMLKKHSFKDSVSLADVDLFLHMNNGRYRRAMDFARLAYFADCGLLEHFLKTGAFPLMVAATGRYRQPLLLFQKFRIITKLMYWDQEKLYLEQRFIGQFRDEDEFVFSVNFVAMRLTKENSKELFEAVLGYVPETPERTQDLNHFLDYIKESSASLKKL